MFYSFEKEPKGPRMLVRLQMPVTEDFDKDLRARGWAESPWETL